MVHFATPELEALITKRTQKYEKMLADLARRAHSTCTKGCFNCCYLLPIVSVLDGMRIAQRLLNQPDWEAYLEPLATQARLQIRATKLQYFTGKHACVFLKDGLCSVYDVRPDPCRFHFMLSPPELCSPDRPHTATQAIDLRDLEWEACQVSVKMFGLSAAPLAITVLHCMAKLAEDLDRLKIKTYLDGIPNPSTWVQAHGERIYNEGAQSLTEGGQIPLDPRNG